MPLALPPSRGALLPHRFALTIAPVVCRYWCDGGMFSVALSAVGFPRPAVSRHPSPKVLGLSSTRLHGQRLLVRL